MSFSSSILVTFRIWLNWLFGFQTLKLSVRFSKNGTRAVAKCYNLLLVGLIMALEFRYLSSAIQSSYREFQAETNVAYIILSLTGATAAISAILSDAFIHASKKVNLYNHFQKIDDIFLDENFSLSTVLCHTNTVFVILVALKFIHSAFVLWTLGWSIYIFYIISRTFILSLMILQILTEIYTCASHIKFIRNNILWSNHSQVSAQTGIDFRATSFSSNGSEEEIILKKMHNSATKVQMNVYALINENLKLISKRFKYAVTIIRYDSIKLCKIGKNQ